MTNSTRSRRKHPKTAATASILFALSLLTALLFVLSGYGYQWEIWQLGTAFTILTYSAYAAIGLVLINLVALFFIRKRLMRKGFRQMLTAILLTLAVTGTAYYWQNEARQYPPIHDITTDIENPPAFDAIVSLRAEAPNPPEYAGEETAQTQREAYPDLGSLTTNLSPDEVFNAVVALVEDRGWSLAQADQQNGIVEATEKMAWFGFEDDVVIRVEATESGTRVDMRSKSRIGRGDLGVNAHRIRTFLSDLEESL
ncbi:MAG: DUF1499 domain-containing protein [Balneolaceae bacterium]